ncbi:MAG: class I SAM-dependent methyltransferase, partial [Rhodothermales bacterium]|nr:class I SAM-dependent methyltransferase [Rhodothermales bacterium]
MTRKLKRHPSFELAIRVTDDEFIRPPREAQRNWLLNRALGELVLDLEHLDRQARRFVAGSEEMIVSDRTQAVLSDDEIMEDWQIPVMEAMADVVTESHGDVLEIGFGRGVASDMIQDRGVRSHTIVECNDAIVERYHDWRERGPDATIHLIHGKWQDTIDRFEQYDGIFFHTYPLNEEELLENVVNS